MKKYLFFLDVSELIQDIDILNILDHSRMIWDIQVWSGIF